MNDLDFHWIGEWVNFARLVRYYRTMAHARRWNGGSQLAFYNQRLRAVIAERRRQLGEHDVRLAA